MCKPNEKQKRAEGKRIPDPEFLNAGATNSLFLLCGHGVSGAGQEKNEVASYLSGMLSPFQGAGLLGSAPFLPLLSPVHGLRC